VENARALAVRQMAADTEELHAKMAESRKLFARLKVHKHDVLYTISRIRPFAVCPVDGPHAIADGFGIWVHHPKKEGGDHVHQGNDIMAPLGTPIVAPFDGNAVTATNKIGGMAVKVFGEFGYVYNAHLSRFGQLGAVEKGDVVGYVGATGNAGGPHDHFEWHPDNGPAVDPYSFLLQVC
jgi:murein DD-endopeptidase MepM/ murein hydrolase activator NlpD